MIVIAFREMYDYNQPMRGVLIFIFMAMLSLLGGTLIDDVPSVPRADEVVAAAEPRVVIRVNRNEEVMGFVELEDEEVIVVRTPEGELKSFTKSRVVKIIRLADPLPGQHGVVRLRNGQIAQGIILEDSFEQAVVQIEGIPVAFRRRVVEEVELEATFEQRYAQLKASLEPNRPVQHLVFCRWLVENHRYDLAQQELRELLRGSPDSEEARRLLVVVDAQVEMQQKRAAKPQPTDLDSALARDGAELLASDIISHADVNCIRAYEIDFRAPPRLMVSPETIRKLIENYSTSSFMPTSAEGRRALFRAEPLEVVKLMFQVRARDLYPEIQVITEPRALNLFRRRVHDTWLMNSCATSRCHGGPNAGDFFLHEARYRDERVCYTNLLILERLEVDPEWPLINFNVPMDSLIIQYGLPRDEARKPHPDVPGWTPIFTRGHHRMLRVALEWIESMMQPRPQYPVEYEPPTLRAPLSEPEPFPDDDGDRLGR